jgi:hypothetical protein
MQFSAQGGSLDRDSTPGWISRTLSCLAGLAVLLLIVFALHGSLHPLKGSWDDGAITAAFSRTWIESGRIALTPVSPVVEGFSSITWFLLLNLSRYFMQGLDAILVWMKYASAATATVLLWVFFRLAKDEFRDTGTAVSCLLILAFSGPIFTEIQNGMEMNLAALLLLLMFYVLRSPVARKGRLTSGWVFGSLLLLTRFESPYWLFFLFAGLWLERDQDRRVPRRDLIVLAGALVVSFGAIELWRHHQFAMWMPNTVYAKRWMPYRDASTITAMIRTRVKATAELLIVYPGLLLIAILSVVRLRKKPFQKGVSPGIAVWVLAAGACLFGVTFGANWGYPGRMISPALPFVVLVLVSICVKAARPENKTGILWVLVVLQVLTWFVTVTLYKGYGPVSIAAMERKGQGADAIRRALHKESLVVMLPDVGGSSLCCEHLEIVDTGLLTNPYLARHGWPAFKDYFAKVKPDVVETHDMWSQSSNIYGNGSLGAYHIVASNGERFFVRNDLYERLLELKAGETMPVEGVAACLSGMPGEATRIDEAFSRTKGQCLVLK